jgi:hypothetical protein
LKVILKDGRQSEDEIVLTQASATAGPQVIYPLPEQVLSVRNPEIRWTEFTSPEHRSFERRDSEIRVSRLESPEASFDERLGPWWGAFLKSSVSSIRFGTRYEHGIGYGEPELRDGRYLISLGYSEARRFGETILVRESIRIVPFSVRLGD